MISTAQATGGRKRAVAQVFLATGEGKFEVNNKDLNLYFPQGVFCDRVLAALSLLDKKGDYDVRVRVQGGGVSAQAAAIKHALAKALLKINDTNRAALKSAGLLTRDARKVERKKPGQRGARAKFTWTKR